MERKFIQFIHEARSGAGRVGACKRIQTTERKFIQFIHEARSGAGQGGRM